MNKTWKHGGEELWILNDGDRDPPHHHHNHHPHLQYKILVKNKCNAGWKRTFSWVSLCIYDPGVSFVGLQQELEQEEQGADSLPERNLVHINRTEALKFAICRKKLIFCFMLSFIPKKNRAPKTGSISGNCRINTSSRFI